MNRRAVILRESAISVIINMAISIGFFLLAFGLKAPVPVAALGPDFLPQTFMVALMGTLVPSLLLRRKLGVPVRPIVLRCLAIAVLAAAVAGGGAYAVCAMLGTAQLGAYAALALKAAYGGLLAAIVTPLALTALFRSTGGSA